MQSHVSESFLTRYCIVAAVMLATVLEILDTTIVSVSLPHMMGSLGADRDQISWVLTSYIVAAGVLMPLTGFLVNRFGCKRLLMMNVVGFMLASVLCGLSANLAQIVFFRLLQGLFGASLVPLSQFILRTAFPPKDQSKLMAIWGIGIMTAPIMGPTLGGYITEVLNWRWIFYINLPVCLIDLVLIIIFIKESPRQREFIDWIGMILLVVSIGCLQLFLDRGQIEDWFSSSHIRGLFCTFVVSFILFLYHSFTCKNPIINLRLYRDKTFAAGSLVMFFFSASILGSLSLLPQMLETLFGYTSQLTGLTMAPRGIASAIMMVICSRLINRIDLRLFIFVGLIISAVSTYYLSQLTLYANINQVVMLGFFQGIGIGCFFMPLSVIIYSGLPKSAYAEAAGLFSFGRNIGNAMGISLLITYLDRDTQRNWHVLGSHLNLTNARLVEWFSAHHLSLSDPRSYYLLAQELSQQANFIGYLHTFQLSVLLLAAALLFVFIMRPSAGQT